MYGKQRRNGERQAADVDALLHAHPNLRVAYIDETHVNAVDERGLPIVRDDFYSVWGLSFSELISWQKAKCQIRVLC